ncbi:MAG: hypothetical protein WDN31_01590 [Hyphomicrobium sp.]
MSSTKTPTGASPKGFIQQKLLADGAFEGVNPQARGVLCLMVETGIRPSEACGLAEEDIRLDCSVPHVCCRR